MEDIYKLSDELGATFHEDDESVTLWDIRNKSPERKEYLAADEVRELIAFYETRIWQDLQNRKDMAQAAWMRHAG